MSIPTGARPLRGGRHARDQSAVDDEATAGGFDRRVWRVVGDPLVPPTARGPLDGMALAVSDMVAVAGQRRGLGHPVRVATSAPETDHAPVVASLLAAGASVRGIAQIDELGNALTGTNPHVGATTNPRAPDRLAGGANCGAAAAVALGHAQVGLGTDTVGCLRVPAAYQGLWSMRPTQGVVDASGATNLSPSFDTVGWVTAGVESLARVGATLLPADVATVSGLVVDPAILAAADDQVREVLDPAMVGLEHWDSGLLATDAALHAFQTVVAAEAWQVHGRWVEEHADAIGADVGARFRHAASVDPVWTRRSTEQVAEWRHLIRTALAEQVLVVPTAPTVAPLVRDADHLPALRRATIRLTCLAGLGGLPTVSVPLSTTAGVPVGLSLVGPAGSDLALLDLAAALA
ncbi:Amidase [Aeromicrobium marinum DSM 15272]|uniref:Amidase n=1 Tax=Aeromicrobium marinum DSM 15272 TaxID=585531 RepID=E2SBM0_9ACTN|nr:amidase family protein [Aeromicrobium marinum]EFQ83766.1 Amidase [Aeromicrobium marinum DSM 15272]